MSDEPTVRPMFHQFRPGLDHDEIVAFDDQDDWPATAAQAVAQLRRVLADHRAEPAPQPDVDAPRLLASAAATFDGLDRFAGQVAIEAALAWTGAVELLLAEPASAVVPADLADRLGLGTDHDQPSVAQRATARERYAAALPAWRALGLVDDGDRMTALGRWALPRALAMAWGARLDEAEYT